MSPSLLRGRRIVRTLTGGSMFTRLARGAAAVGVALATSVAVVVSAAPAHASTVTPLPPQLTKVGEAVKHAGPGVAARNATKATSLIPGPVGAAFRVISLGMTAFQTSDYWLPFVAGAIDSEAQGTAAPGAVGFVSRVNGIDSVATASTGTQMTIEVTFTQAVGGTMSWSASWTCIRPDGSTTGPHGQAPRGEPAPNAGTVTPHVRTFAVNGAAAECSGAGSRIRDFHYVGTLNAGNNTGTYDYQMASQSQTLTTTVTCRTPSGTTYQVTRTTTRTEVVQSEGTEWALVGVCATGDTPVNLNVASTKDGTSTTRGDYPLSPTDVTHDQQYPLCAGTECLYRIRVDGRFCTTGVEDCTHWSYIWSTNQSRVECFYGAYSIAVSECLFMERAYDTATGARTGTKANTDGDPNTYTTPAPSPPRTSPSTSPSPSPSSTSTSSSSPSPSPTAPVGQPSTDPPTEPAGARCFPSGWGLLNPFEWVYKPVMCAMNDAFVPDPTLTTTRLSSLRSQISTSGPAPAIAQVQDLLQPMGEAGGCSGPAVTFAVDGVSETMHPFSACDEPMSTAATYVKALAALTISVGGALAVVRAIGAGFGFSFSMGKGGDDGV